MWYYSWFAGKAYLKFIRENDSLAFNCINEYNKINETFKLDLEYITVVYFFLVLNSKKVWF